MSGDKKILGAKGEDAAVQFLIKKDYEILERNWRTGRMEIDILAKQNDIIIVIEVKTRTTASFFDPASTVTQRQMNRLAEAYAYYADEVNHEGECRFDIIGVVLQEGQSPRVEHYEDAFFPG